MCVCARAESVPSCLTLCDPVKCSPPGSSVHGTLQARTLEWAAVPSSRGSSRPRAPACMLGLLRWQAGSFRRGHGGSHEHYMLSFGHSVTFGSVTPWTAAHQVSLSFSISWSLLAQTCVPRAGGAIQPSCPLPSPFPPAFNRPQHQEKAKHRPYIRYGTGAIYYLSTYWFLPRTLEKDTHPAVAG